LAGVDVGVGVGIRVGVGGGAVRVGVRVGVEIVEAYLPVKMALHEASRRLCGVEEDGGTLRLQYDPI
jgi:hypothetical protein